MTLKDEESDIQSTLSDAPPDWNSDDEPPDDHVGDENTCSRDGAVRKVIQKVGKGLERPGQNDIITLSFSTLQLDGSDSLPSLSNTTVEMGTNKLPMAVEFAVKHMRVGEVCEVRAPAVYSLQTSPLCGRSLRTQPGVLPKTDKVKRRYRFLPAAPRSVSEQAKKDLLNFRKAKQEATEKGDAFDANSPPMFRASVELLSITCVLALTEDRSVTKRILQKGSSRRQPRRGDVITFSYTIHGDDNARSETCTLTLGKDKLPFSGLHHVLLSMKEEECCLARLSSAAALPEGEDCSETHEPLPVSLEVTLLRWRRRDLLPVGEVDTPAGGGSDACALLKTEIRQGPERRCHDIEAGSMVLAAMVIGEGEASLLSWRVGEGAVPGYMDVAVASMRFCESAAFEASEIVQACRPVGPSYEGQTPLRTLKVSALDPWLVDLLKEQEVAEDSPREGASAQVLPLLPIPADWTMQGEVKSWSDLAAHLKSDGCFKLVFLAATEAVDLCLLEEDGQMHFLELERAHGNALAKVGRFEEASEAYRRALDAVRHGSLYKALFPTERGHIQGAYSREAFEGDPLQKMSEEEVSTRRGQLVALHLNLSLCATKAGLYALARRHAETALGAEPGSAKALFRRGQAAAGQGDYEDALQDLQKAAELMPQDRGIRAEIQTVQHDLRAHREAQKNMFVKVFQPPDRVQGDKQ